MRVHDIPLFPFVGLQTSVLERLMVEKGMAGTWIGSQVRECTAALYYVRIAQYGFTCNFNEYSYYDEGAGSTFIYVHTF